MKILFLNQTFHPDKAGTAQQLTQLARAMVAEGHEVTVLCSQRSYEDPSVLHSSEETFEGIRVVRVASPGWGKRSFFHRMVDGIGFELGLVGRLLRMPRPDVVVSFTSPPMIGFVGTLAARRWRAANVQWLMDIHPNVAIAVGYLSPRSLLSRLLVRLLRFTLSHSDVVIVLDEFMKREAIRCGAAPETLRIIPPWLPEGFSAPASPPDRENAFRRRHGLEGKFVVLYSGNHSIVHPLETLLEAARCLESESGVRFLFVGGGLRKQEVVAFRDKYALENILELPYQPKETLAESLAAGDLHVVILGDRVNGLVHPSKIYGVMASGRPYLFLGPKDSPIGRLLEECPGGIQVDHGKPEQVAAAIRELLSRSDEDRRAMGQLNLDYLRVHYLNRDSFGLFSRDVLGSLRQKMAGSPSPSVPSSDSPAHIESTSGFRKSTR